MKGASRRWIALALCAVSATCCDSRYVRFNEESREAAAESAAAALESQVALPEQIHIALAGRGPRGEPTSVRVSWATPIATATSTVRYGYESGNLSLQANGSAVSYFENWNHHTVLLPTLVANSSVFYQCGDDTAGWSDVLSFTFIDSLDRVQFNVSVFGDMGYGQNGNAIATHTTLLNFVQPQVDFVWHLGDIAYADDAFLHTPVEFKYEDVYNDWMNWMEPMTSQKPYMVTPGNHEAECHSPACLLWEPYRNSLANFSAYNARWNMPFKESQSKTNMWYSFNYGTAHFVSMDTETDFPGAPEETRYVLPTGGFGQSGEFLAWLEEDLRQANMERDIRPWIIVGGHRPMYSFDNADKYGNLTGPNLAFQRAFEDLFYDYGVDLFICGHIHKYRRSKPVYKNKVDANGTIYLVAGASGCDESNLEVDSTLRQMHAEETTTYPEWHAFEDSNHYSTGILRFVDKNTIVWDLIASGDNRVLDTVTLQK